MPVWAFTITARLVELLAPDNTLVKSVAVATLPGLPANMAGLVQVFVMPPGESLHGLETSVKQSLEACKKTHRKYPNGYYNMNVATVSVSDVGVTISKDLDANYYAVISGANCPQLARDISAAVAGDLDLPLIDVRTEW